MTSSSTGSRTVNVNPVPFAKSSACRRRSERFSSSDMPSSGGQLPSGKPGVARMCSMLDIHAAWSASLCCGPNGSRRNGSVTRYVGGLKPGGTKVFEAMARTLAGRLALCIRLWIDAVRLATVTLTAEPGLGMGGHGGPFLAVRGRRVALPCQDQPGRTHRDVVPKVELMRADHYDGFAESYSTENESSLANAYYERPAMIDLAGDVSGRRVLDAGCGSGPLSAALRVKGAIVTGFDSSPAMVKLARQRLGGNAALCVADLSRPLPFADGAFDDVVSREPGTAFLAGGTTLVDLLRIYAVQPHHPVDINSLSLSDVDDLDGRGIRIGARAGGGRGDPGPGGLRRGARHHPPGRRDAGVVH